MCTLRINSCNDCETADFTPINLFRFLICFRPAVFWGATSETAGLAQIFDLTAAWRILSFYTSPIKNPPSSSSSLRLWDIISYLSAASSLSSFFPNTWSLVTGGCLTCCLAFQWSPNCVPGLADPQTSHPTYECKSTWISTYYILISKVKVNS